MKLFFLLLSVLGTVTTFSQTLEAPLTINVRSNNSTTRVVYTDTMARFILPDPSIFSPAMENLDTLKKYMLGLSHPEQESGEVYLINVYTTLYWEHVGWGLRITGVGNNFSLAIEKALEKLPFDRKTMRVGKYAMSRKFCTPLIDCVPIFIQASELEKFGML